MRIIRPTVRIIKGFYDILATYLLAWVLLFALLALVFQTVLAFLSAQLGFDSLDSFWMWVDQRAPWPSLSIRLWGFAALHLVTLWTLRRRLGGIKAALERAADGLQGLSRAWARRHPRSHTVWSAGFTLIVTLLLVPFVIQPTLVERRWSSRAWAQRAANLADGTASAELLGSVVGLYRRLVAHPVRSKGVPGKDLDTRFPGDSDGYPADGTFPIRGTPVVGPPPDRSSFMDRWDPLISQVVGDDPRAFALLKALIWVESGGRQFSVSHTGCAGLTQFCSRTARARPYRGVFGTGQVYPCRCAGSCKVPWSVQRDLESGDMSRVQKHESDFPCDLSDARFDPLKAIQAASLYVDEMKRQHGGNIYLVYVGYNSGLGVSQRVWRALGKDPGAGLDSIGLHLADALRPFFGAAADRRARSLLGVHLPKLRRAYDLYLGRAGSPAAAVASKN